MLSQKNVHPKNTALLPALNWNGFTSVLPWAWGVWRICFYFFSCFWKILSQKSGRIPPFPFLVLQPPTFFSTLIFIVAGENQWRINKKEPLQIQSVKQMLTWWRWAFFVSVLMRDYEIYCYGTTSLEAKNKNNQVGLDDLYGSLPTQVILWFHEVLIVDSHQVWNKELVACTIHCPISENSEYRVVMCE